MILYPAIDLKDGACVRLLRGDMDAATVFGTDPAAQAAAFAGAGAEWLHLVDLNGAFAGRPVNGDAVQAIDFPESPQVVNNYPVATIKDSQQAEAANEFVSFVRGPAGREVLGAHGFDVP